MVSTKVPADEGLDATTFRVYVYMVKAGRLVGPRDVMRGAGLSSPSVAHRQLQKLLDLGLVQKDMYGRYEVKEKTGLKGYFWFGKMLVPRLIFYSLFFIGFLVVEIIIVAIHLSVNEPVDLTLALLTLVTVTSAILFLSEGIRLRSVET